ncbi:MAG: hypothetical protein SGJ11_14850 [Phycisphaerae bacterium]|nr:hypothetical protein [Phycisphaerae bacterium]
MTLPYESGLSPYDSAQALAQTLADARRVLGPLDDASLAAALRLLFEGSLTDIAYLVRDGDMPLNLRLDALRSIEVLYDEVLELRAGDTLQSQATASSSELQQTIFMIWDVSPLTYWPPSGHARAASRCLAETFGAVLGRCRSAACIESALHGLGHLHNSNADAAKEAISRWMSQRPDVPDELLDYAELAWAGTV